MPAGVVSCDLTADANAVFDLIHDYDRRLEWDPFLRRACLLDGASSADVGISSRCVARWLAGGMAMDTVYVSFNRPTVAAVKMTRGPFFLDQFAASIRLIPASEVGTRIEYRFHFGTSPLWKMLGLERIVAGVFRRETERRLQALKQFLESS